MTKIRKGYTNRKDAQEGRAKIEADLASELANQGLKLGDKKCEVTITIQEMVDLESGEVSGQRVTAELDGEKGTSLLNMVGKVAMDAGVKAAEKTTDKINFLLALKDLSGFLSENEPNQ